MGSACNEGCEIPNIVQRLYGIVWSMADVDVFVRSCNYREVTRIMEVDVGAWVKQKYRFN